MELYADGKLAAATADAGALDAALAGLGEGRLQSLELRDSAQRHLAVCRGADGACLLEVAQRAGVFGLRFGRDDFGQVRAAFEEFLQGYTPRLPWKRLAAELKAAGGRHIVLGDPYRDDCPLCRARG